MTRFLHAWFPKSAPTPRAVGPGFKPGVERLDDRVNPALGFDPQQTFAVNAGAWGAQAADFNADGRVDLVTANSSGTVSVLINTTPNGEPTPTFAPKQDLAIPTPINVEVGDMNGDGRPDLVATTNPNVVSVFLNTTPAGASSTAVSFAPRQDFTITGVSEIALGDFNSDGRPDLAALLQGSNSVSIRLNTTPMHGGLVTFGLLTGTVAVGSSPFDVTVGDFNADGRPDIATANVTTNNVSVALNTTAIGLSIPTFATKQDFAAGTTPLGVAVGDVNGDGRLDLVAVNNGGTVSVFVNTMSTGAATASFAAKQDFAVGTNSYYATVDDFDGDGRADIAVVNDGTNNVSILVNTTPAPGATTVSFSKTDFALGGSPRNPVAADFNGDGRPDLAVPNNDDANISVLRNTSTNVKPTTTGPALVAQYGTNGVWAYKRDTGTWIQLTAANANAVAASASGNVIASFGGNGVWYYRASTGLWSQINGLQALALCIDPLGNAYISWSGFGTYRYNLHNGTFSQIGASAADKLVCSPNGDVVGNFPGFGVYRYQRTAPVPFSQINGFNATSLDVDRNGYVVAAFNGFGVGHYIPYAKGWRTVAPFVTAPAVALDGYGNIYASFPGNGGVFKFDYTNTWKNIAPSATAQTLAVDWYGNVFASFGGFPGTWEFNPYFGWNWRPQGFASIVSLAK